MSAKNNNNGVGFFGLLTIAFIVLKLMKYIDWSWWWVLSPIWVPIILVIVFTIVAIVISAVKEVSKENE